jgi:hypothetical protein
VQDESRFGLKTIDVEELPLKALSQQVTGSGNLKLFGFMGQLSL